MSRIGNKVIVLPAGVSVSVAEDNIVSVKGPKGTLTQAVDSDITVAVEGSELKVTRPTEPSQSIAWPLPFID
jgi:large subunit ribosomal protein L6